MGELDFEEGGECGVFDEVLQLIEEVVDPVFSIVMVVEGGHETVTEVAS